MASPEIHVTTRACKNCGASFSFPNVGRGFARLHCTPRCTQEFNARSAKNRSRDLCCAEGCESPANRVSVQLCERHYYRLRRNGTFSTRRVRKERRRTSHGYMIVGVKGHPLAPKDGTLYEHRLVHYEDIGPGVHHCVWCGIEVEWGAKGKRKLVVDHFDGVKDNNEPGNLLTSCQPCNGKRGLFEAWAREHKDDPFLTALIERART